MQPLPYQFVEFPKWVTPPGAAPAMVHTAEQEAAVMAAYVPPTPSDPPPEPGADVDRDALRLLAVALGIVVDGRWGADRLIAEIAARAAQPELPA